jgi:hypothetical protein
VPDAIESATLIGAAGHAAVLEHFASVIDDGEHRSTQEEFNRRLEAMTDRETQQLDVLDQQFYALVSIDDYLTAYLETHPDEFFTG